MNPFILLLIPTFTGILALTAILHNVPMKHKGLFLLGASLPTGFGIISLIVFISFLIMPSAGKNLSMLGVMIFLAGSLIPAIRMSPAGARSDFFQSVRKSVAAIRDFFRGVGPGSILKSVIAIGSFLIFVVSLSKALRFQSLALPGQIFGGWDARYVWTLKAKFIFQSPADWLLLFSPTIPWAHPDYPLLLSNSIAWGWQILGNESLLWGPAVALGFYFSCALLIVWYLAEHVSSASGWIGGAFFAVLSPYGFWTLQQYADVPVAFFLAASGLLLVTALRYSEKKLFVLAGLMAGLAAWTKNEGLMFVVWIGLILTGIGLKRHKIKAPRPFAPLANTLLGAALPLIAVITLKIFLGTSGDDFESKRTIANYMNYLFSGGSRLWTTLEAFGSYTVLSSSWKNLWGFFLLAICLGPFKRAPWNKEHRWILFLLVVLINGGYFLAIYTTPYDLQWQIRTALSRLVLHSGILALAFTLETLTFRKNSPVKTGIPSDYPFPSNENQDSLSDRSLK